MIRVFVDEDDPTGSSEPFFESVGGDNAADPATQYADRFLGHCDPRRLLACHCLTGFAPTLHLYRSNSQPGVVFLRSHQDFPRRLSEQEKFPTLLNGNTRNARFYQHRWRTSPNGFYRGGEEWRNGYSNPGTRTLSLGSGT